MSEFARRQRIANPAGDAETGYRLRFDDSLELRCFERFNNLHLVSPLGPPPDDVEARRQWLRGLLNQALIHIRQHPTTPMLETNGEVALFSRFDDIRNMPPIVFEDVIENHINCLESLARVLTTQAPPRTAAMPQMVFRP